MDKENLEYLHESVKVLTTRMKEMQNVIDDLEDYLRIERIKEERKVKENTIVHIRRTEGDKMDIEKIEQEIRKHSKEGNAYTKKDDDIIFHIPKYAKYGDAVEKVGTVDISLKKLMIDMRNVFEGGKNE